MKLIDWSAVPRGTMTNKGELLAVYSVEQYGKVLAESDEIDMVEIEDLRIVPATRWTYHDGKSELDLFGLIAEHEFLDMDGERATDCGRVVPIYARAYRITGVDRAGGWTDDPSEVTE